MSSVCRRSGSSCSGPMSSSWPRFSTTSVSRHSSDSVYNSVRTLQRQRSFVVYFCQAPRAMLASFSLFFFYLGPVTGNNLPVLTLYAVLQQNLSAELDSKPRAIPLSSWTEFLKFFVSIAFSPLSVNLPVLMRASMCVCVCVC